MTDKNYRNLTPEEISQLEKQGNKSENWIQIEVTDGFSPDSIVNVIFIGKVKIGATGKIITNPDGIGRISGLYNCQIIDCTIGDNVYISKIGTYISCYDIADDVYIEDTGKIVCTGKSSFGNNVKVAALNEGGGREVPIYNELNAQIAYILTMYRHRPKMIEAIEGMIGRSSVKIDKSRGKIGRGVQIICCNTVRDTIIGDYAVLFGVSEVSYATIKSSEDAPTYIGTGVKAREFICGLGSHIDNGAVLSKCYIGEACHIDFAFVAVDSLFFANSHCAAGEAASIFAGPYTVSHHRSTLMIAGYFSFFNAGSGSNQSNHLFRSGAVHQGIHERGTKFGSSSYIMLPAREGLYTVVTGKHRSHHDTTDFPYSYLVEDMGQSYLIPAANLINHGTMRDLAKWPERDRRGAVKSDLINFREFTPHVGNKLARAVFQSENMLARGEVNVFNFERTRIKRSVLRRGLRLYQQALDAAIASILEEGYDNIVDADTEWVDMAGMFAPKREVDKILDKIEAGSLKSTEEIDRELIKLHDSYRDHAYAWAMAKLEETVRRQPEAEDIRDAVSRGKEAFDTIYSMRIQNARQDVGEIMGTGYGIDSADKEIIASDFKSVRGVDM